ncbi:class I SAM-dependent methyltransferase [Nitrosarchaeum koreense]|uniref:Methyltransferase type 11 n=1 Tax=Nitrosarchaeum koreense MY1 TaxID=1001994 RepID=F9CXC3_9ARCH|nr:class I SAM-dependent methyltransferase [Nitrosarchaeum koreense]EGP93925.1 Methyltransferase type 11 [Nitrosarchaeum koreense MY1]
MKTFLNVINPVDMFFWTIRKNEKDVINLYNSLSPIMQLATGGSMLNFGYWEQNTSEPIVAQENLCSYFGNMAELENAKSVVDVGSGLSAPAIFWRKKYNNLKLFCININYDQLQFSGPQENMEFINSTSTKLPFSNRSVDRVLALESSQHFKPLKDFISESKRVLKSDGVFTLALPVTLQNTSLFKLGILKFTWSSEHYKLDYVRELVQLGGFKIHDEQLIGNKVYTPLANYYIENRQELKKSILQKYPNYVEKILYKSILKMKKASDQKIIDYVVLKCKF